MTNHYSVIVEYFGHVYDSEIYHLQFVFKCTLRNSLVCFHLSIDINYDHTHVDETIKFRG